MTLVAAIVAGFLCGYRVWPARRAFLLTAAAIGIVLIPQTIFLWNAERQSIDVFYPVVQTLIVALGFVMTRTGAWMHSRRHQWIEKETLVRTLLAALAVPGILLAPSPASASVVHDRSSWFDVTWSEHDFNICGDLATFNFESTGHVITTETESGFHFTFIDNDVYTVDFDDPALGTWTARATETSTFNATPGDVITLHVGNNNMEGDVRIRELTTLIIGPDGEVRVDRTTFEVVGC